MTLPIIDMSGLRSGVAGEREAVGRALNEACLDMGFFYLTDHQVSAQRRDAAMAALREFFSRPLDRKLEAAKARATVEAAPAGAATVQIH